VLLGHSRGSFAAQQYVLNHAHLIDALALADPLCGFSLSPPTEHRQAHYDPISTLGEAGQNP
jgi:pimeloyl-ACP methyl ester carboxylesterase